jgi:DNA processing protein
MTELKSWLALSLTQGLGAIGCKKLVDYFGSPSEVLKASPGALANVSGIKNNALESLKRPHALEDASRELEAAARKKVSVLCFDSEKYPEHLKNIHNPPVILYARGNLDILNLPAIGIVGSRAASGYGLSVAERLGFQLADAGVSVISGLALGIDTAAHQGALNAQGKTLAVLGCGLDVVYPTANRDLWQRIGSQGLLLTEYPLGTRPEGFRFPARNRIISGLSLGLVVVEAARRSGSLITARHAMEQGREVFAVPGRVDSVKSAGPHRLVQEGAKLVHDITDIFEELSMEGKGNHLFEKETTLNHLTGTQKVLMDFLDVYPKNINQLILETGFHSGEISRLLLDLELMELVEVLPGNQYKLK